MLLFQFSNGENGTSLKNSVPISTLDDDQAYFKECIKEGGQLLGSLKKICIESEYLGEIQWWPTSDREDLRTELSVDIRNFQVIQIDTSMDTITMGMKMTIEWPEYRIDLNDSGQVYNLKSQIMYLDMEEQKRIWSPRIVIGNNMVSKEKIGEVFGFYRKFDMTNFFQYVGINTFYLSTIVKCDMDLQDFPFDDHVCQLEVSFEKYFWILPFKIGNNQRVSGNYIMFLSR